MAAPGEVSTQQSASARALLEEVVVTARRREESLEDPPLSIAAINADAMQARGICDIMPITGFVPNVGSGIRTAGGGRGSSSAVSARGPGACRSGGVGRYLDGRYIPGNNGSVMSALEMERVEVLRRPQGTRFGKHTISRTSPSRPSDIRTTTSTRIRRSVPARAEDNGVHREVESDGSLRVLCMPTTNTDRTNRHRLRGNHARSAGHILQSPIFARRAWW